VNEKLQPPNKKRDTTPKEYVKMDPYLVTKRDPKIKYELQGILGISSKTITDK
jgi:hypothetical protein